MTDQAENSTSRAKHVASPFNVTGADLYKLKILAALAGPGGFTTGGVAEHVTPMFGSNKRQHSAAIRAWLLELKTEGKVRAMDDEKPVVWCSVKQS